MQADGFEHAISVAEAAILHGNQRFLRCYRFAVENEIGPGFATCVFNITG